MNIWTIKNWATTKQYAANTGFASGGVTCKLGALCFYSSSVLVDSFVLRNPPERKARNRLVARLGDRQPRKMKLKNERYEMRKVSGSLNSTFYLPQLSKTYVAYGAGIPIMQGQSQESSSMLRIICTVLIDFIVVIIMNKVTNRILPEREIGATFNRVLRKTLYLTLICQNIHENIYSRHFSENSTL